MDRIELCVNVRNKFPTFHACHLFTLSWAEPEEQPQRDQREGQPLDQGELQVLPPVDPLFMSDVEIDVPAAEASLTSAAPEG